MTTPHRQDGGLHQPSQGKIIIRKGSSNDLVQIVKLFDAYRMFYGYATDMEQATGFVSERLTRGDSEIFVAEAGREILAGFVQLYPLFSSTRLKRLWLLNDLYVDETFRGRQISVMLIDEAKRLAVQTDAAGLILETARSNAIGNQLYTRTGFGLDKDHHFYSWEVGC